MSLYFFNDLENKFHVDGFSLKDFVMFYMNNIANELSVDLWHVQFLDSLSRTKLLVYYEEIFTIL